MAIGIKNTNIADDPNERMKQFYAIEMLNEILYSRSGEFFNTLYDQNLISFDLDASVEHSEFYSFNVISTESKDPEAVYDYFVSFIEKTKEQGLDKEAFELARRAIYASNIKMFDSTDDIAEALITNYLEDTELFEIPDTIMSIDYEYASKIFYELYNEDAYAMSVVNPIGTTEEK